MTAVERQKVVNALAAEICSAESELIKLNRVPSILSHIEIDRSVYSKQGVKRWLKEFFPEFAIDGNCGLETMRLSESGCTQIIGQTLARHLRTQPALLFSSIPDILQKELKMDYRKYTPAGKGLKSWLLSSFSEFKFDQSEDGNSLIQRKSTPRPPDPAEAANSLVETRQMHALAFMNWWNVNGKKIRQYNNFCDLDDKELRNSVAHSMALALLDQRDRLLNALEETPSQLAFPTGLTASNGQPLYCVLGANPQNANRLKQSLALTGFCYLGEQAENGLGEWVASHITPEAPRAGTADPRTLLDKMEETAAAGQTLTPLVERYLSDLNRGQIPGFSLSGPAGEYERLWSELRTLLDQFPTLTIQEPLQLQTLERTVRENNTAAELAAQALAAFGRMVDGLNQFYDTYTLRDSDEPTPNQDLAQAQALCGRMSDPKDAEAFRALLRPYRDLLSAMCARKWQDVQEELETVTGHFREIPFKFAIQVLPASKPSEYHFLSEVDSIDQLLCQCALLLSPDTAAETEDGVQPVDARTLLAQALEPNGGGLNWWIVSLKRVFPQDPLERALVRGDREELPAHAAEKLRNVVWDATPYGAAMRLMAVYGSPHDLAEKYLILGLRFDAERCASALLRLYREEHQKQSFLAVWNQYHQDVYCPDEELAYWLTLEYADQPLTPGRLDALESFLDQHPTLVRNDGLRQVFRRLTPQLQYRPAAFWAWLGAGDNVPSNPFEEALANNNVDLIYSKLDDETFMREMGYSAPAIDELRSLLLHGIPSDPAQVMRLLPVREKQDDAVEALLWAKAPGETAVQALFDRYRARGDHASLCWLARRFPMNFQESDPRTAAYLEALVLERQTETLAGFVRAHPALLYRPGVLAELAGAERALPEEERVWTGLYRWHSGNPFAEPCPFERALAGGDSAEMRSLLENSGQMADWGYSASLLDRIRDLLNQPGADERLETLSKPRRVNDIQGNLHRFYERLLLQSLDSDREDAYGQLFHMLCSQGRCHEAAIYYEAYPDLAKSEQNTLDYLHALAELRRYDDLLAQAGQSPKCLLRDPGLTDMILKTAESQNRMEFASKIRRVLSLLPKNRFEESIIHLNLANIQQMVSDPNQLLELGYSREEIARFKDCVNKPLLSGNTGFPVGSRVRSFLGDARAEQFLIDSESDPQSARMLFDIYAKHHRWDDLCYLYRRHLDADVWNQFYSKAYKAALLRSTSKENCQELLDWIDRLPQGEKDTSTAQWLYLRALLGVGRLSELEQQEELILSSGFPFKPALAASFFEMLWHSELEDGKEQSVLFSAKLYEVYRDQLTPQELKALVTVNGRLSGEPDQSRWAAFLTDCGAGDFLLLLNCCLPFDAERQAQYAPQALQKLSEKLDASGDREVSRSELPLYSEYIVRLEPAREWDGLIRRLLSAWRKLLLSHTDQIDQGAWDAFTAHAGGMARRAPEYRQMLELWSDVVDAVQSAEEKQLLLIYGQRIYAGLLEAQAAGGEDLDQVRQAMSEKLSDVWAGVFEQENAITQEGWDAFIQFWRTADPNQTQLARMDAAWSDLLEGMDQPEGRFFSNFTSAVSAMDRLDYVPSFLNRLMDLFISWLGCDGFLKGEEDGRTVQTFLSARMIGHDQIAQVIGAAAKLDVFSNETFQDILFSCCEQRWPDLSYQWIKLQCRSGAPDGKKREKLLQQLMDLVLRGGIDGVPDGVDLQLLHEAACADLSLQSLQLLTRAYDLAGRQECVQILRALEQGDWQGKHPESLMNWLLQVLEGRGCEWIDRYSGWWAPLVRLSSEDQQTKTMIDFLGLTEGQVEDSYRFSVTRLLLSNLNNPSYLRCFMRINPNLPPAVCGKLEYLEARSDPAKIDTAVRQCIGRGQYELAVDLLIRKMDSPQSNSSVTGQLIGALYTPDTLRECPMLRKRIPTVLDGIKRMNETDPQGKWKNLGRAVDIVCAAGDEERFFDFFGQEVLLQFPDKCAVVIASMVLGGKFEAAGNRLSQTKLHNSQPYLTLLEHVIGECLESGALSRKNELLVRSIPQEGNQRSLESYGELVDFALERGWRAECAEAFAVLFEMDPADKGLASCCAQLYTAGKMDIEFLYRVLKEYFLAAQGAYMNRVAYSLAVIHCCLPDGEEKNTPVAAFCMRRINARDQAALLSELMSLENQCRDFLHGEEDSEKRRDILIRAATGWWVMDHQILRLLGPRKDLLHKLVKIYPVSFSAACFRSALNYQADAEYRGELARVLGQCGSVYNLGRCAKKIDCVTDISPLRIRTVVDLLDCPLELPGLYHRMVEHTLQNDDRAQVSAELYLIFAIQPNFTYQQYTGNVLRIKEMVTDRYPQYEQLVLQRLTQMSANEISPRDLQKPEAYLNAGNYLMMINAAQYWLDQTKAQGTTSPFFDTLNDTYLKLGQILTQQNGAGEQSRIHLQEFLNMTVLLCQSKSFKPKDLNVLMGMCKTTWKICIRCTQELVQGNPRDILDALKEADFVRHKWCAAFVERMARNFIGSKGEKALQDENKRLGRDPAWGTFQVFEIPAIEGEMKIYLLKVSRRNPVQITPFRRDFDRLLSELRREDSLGGTAEPAEDAVPSTEILNAYRSFRSIPYVVEQVERWLPQIPADTREFREKQRKLTKALDSTALSKSEYIDALGQLIAMDWNSSGSTTLCWYCVNLGLRLFDERCERHGVSVCATPQAREILYALAPCLPGVSSYPSSIKTDLKLCLVSYEDLSELIQDCTKPELLSLCQAINDSQVRNSFQNYIMYVREIGGKISTSMTTIERLDWIRDCIKKCQEEMNNFDSEPRQKLIVLLNQQVTLLQGMTQVVLTIFNDTGTRETGHLFGKIENLGAHPIFNIRLTLSVEGVISQKYTLPQLEGNSMIPVELAYEVDEDLEELPYSIQTNYSLRSGGEEQLSLVEGTLRLEDPDDLDFNYTLYKVDAPASGSEYVDRANIRKVLNALYGPQQEFKDFPNLAVYGMKRTGKSSVLRRLEDMLSERGEDPVLCAETSGEGVTGSPVDRVHSILVRQVIRSLALQMAGRPGWEQFQERWSPVPSDAAGEDWGWLDDFFTALNRNFLSHRGLVVLVDEAENLYWNQEVPADDAGVYDRQITLSAVDEAEAAQDDPAAYLSKSRSESESGGAGSSALWNMLSRITQRGDSMVRFVLCGSDFFTNKVLQGDNLTQFFQRIKRLSIGRMDRAELEEAMRALEEANGCDLRFHPDTLGYLWDITNGLPWHSKLIVNSIIERRLIHDENSTRGVIYPSDITWGAEQILDSPIASSDNNFGVVALTEDEQIILRVLTRDLKTSAMKISDSALRLSFREEVGDESWESRYERAVKILLSERNMLQRIRVDREEHYRFGCELYRLYNRRDIPEQFTMR